MRMVIIQLPYELHTSKQPVVKSDGDLADFSFFGVNGKRLAETVEIWLAGLLPFMLDFCDRSYCHPLLILKEIYIEMKMQNKERKRKKNGKRTNF